MILPLISVIVPIHNTEKYLDECINSIVNQSYHNLEIILIDDGSTDRCLDICNYYAERDNRIIVLHQENKGQVSARDAGLQIAKGRYVGFVDSDDWIEKNLFQEVYEKGIVKEAEIIGIGSVKEFEDETISYNISIPEGYYANERFIKEVAAKHIGTNYFYQFGWLSTLWSYVYKKEIVYSLHKNIDKYIRHGEDGTLLLELMWKLNSAYFIKSILYHYRQQEGITAKKRGDYKSKAKEGQYILKILKDWLEGQFINLSIKPIVEKQIGFFMFYYFMFYCYQVVLEKEKDVLFPYMKVKRQSNIIIYGAGQVGKNIYEAVNNTGFCNIVDWVDIKYKRYCQEGKSVHAPDSIQQRKYDYVVLAIMDAKTRMEVKKWLRTIGVPENKIADIEEDQLTIENAKKYLDLK